MSVQLPNQQTFLFNANVVQGHVFQNTHLPDEEKEGECHQSQAGLVRSMLANQPRRGTEHKVALLKKRGAGKTQNKGQRAKVYAFIRIQLKV